MLICVSSSPAMLYTGMFAVATAAAEILDAETLMIVAGAAAVYWGSLLVTRRR